MTTEERERALDNLLLTWAEWMTTGRLPLGYPRSSAGFHGWRSSQTFDDLATELDIDLARTVDAAMSDLPRLERDALATALLRSRWRHAAAEYSNSLAEARAALAERLAKRGVLG